MNRGKAVVPMQFQAYRLHWLALLVVDGMRWRLVLLCYYCPGHRGWHTFKGF